MRSHDGVSASSEFEGFEWDEKKRLTTLQERGIDFVRAVEIFDRPHLVKRSDRGEERYIAIGATATGDLLAVVYAPRAKVCRIISVRKVRTNEQRAYLHAITIAPDERPD